MEETVIQRKSDFDLGGLGMIINSFGKCSHTNLNEVLPAFKPLIFARINEIDINKILLILSGITF